MLSNSRILPTTCIALFVLTLTALSDDDKLRDLGTNAAPGEIPKWDGSQWRNAHDDITTVVPGPGLNAGGTNTTVTIGVSFAGTGTSNAVARSDHNHSDLEATRPPVGAVVAWLKSFANTPQALPAGWVECNGQTLEDTSSVYHQQIIPNLNGTSGSPRRFLRGGQASGSAGGTETHTHYVGDDDGATGQYFNGRSTGVGGIVAAGPGGNTGGNFLLSQTSPSGHLPSYYEVVWIMRVK